ncbi:hypothetical protein EV426DRAFT_722084 [Tirmania nivea]|nr:hypothetical protein EV426DRAFT_722084 [Tirmania nivea]
MPLASPAGFVTASTNDTDVDPPLLLDGFPPQNVAHLPSAFATPDASGCSRCQSLPTRNVPSAQSPPSAQTILTACPKSIGTIFRVDIRRPKSGETSLPMLTSSRPPRVSTSTAANRRYDTTGEYVMIRVPDITLRHFAYFLQQNATAVVDPRFAPFISESGSSLELGLDVGLVLGGEADVRLAVYHSTLLPVWGVIRACSWPDTAVKKQFCWLNERGKRAMGLTDEPTSDATLAIPDSTICFLYTSSDNSSDNPTVATPRSKRKSRHAQSQLPKIRGHPLALVEYKPPGTLDTVIVRTSQTKELQVVTGSTNWTNLVTQLRKYAVNYGVRHQLVMDGSYALYIEFVEMEPYEDSYDAMRTADVHIRHLIVEFSASSHGIWDVDQVGNIVLNSREIVMFLVWNASASITSSLGPPPTLSDMEAIQRAASGEKGADESRYGEKRTRSSYAGGGNLSESGATGGPSSTGDNKPGKRGRFQGNHGNREDGQGDKSGINFFQDEPQDGPPVSTTLPPVGTIFKLIPAEPAPIDDSGFWDNETDVDDTSAHGESTSGHSLVIETQSETYPPSSNVTSTEPLCPRASLARAIYNLTHSAASSFAENGHGIIAQINKLFTPYVALVTLLSPTLESEPTTGPHRIIMKSFPGEDTSSADKGPLTGLLPSQFPLPTELSAYKAFSNAGAGSDHANDGAVPVPHYFGAWKYLPLSTPCYPNACPATPQFTVLLIEDLSAPGLDGQTLLDYLYPVKSTRPNIAAVERDILYDAAKLSLEWLHTKAHVSHRDLSESNIIILQDPVRVVLIDFDQAAVGETVLEGCGALIPTNRRRYVDAIKGWGRVDKIVLREIFERVRVVGGCEDEEGGEDQGGEDEESGEKSSEDEEGGEDEKSGDYEGGDGEEDNSIDREEGGVEV